VKAEYSSLDLVESGKFVGLTFRKLDYWCHRGIFGDVNVAPGIGRGRRFTSEDLRVAVILAQVSAAIETWTGGRGGFAPILRDLAKGIRANESSLIVIPAAPGVELHVDLTAIGTIQDDGSD
jgi:hypothetical protein